MALDKCLLLLMRTEARNKVRIYFSFLYNLFNYRAKNNLSKSSNLRHIEFVQKDLQMPILLSQRHFKCVHFTKTTTLSRYAFFVLSSYHYVTVQESLLTHDKNNNLLSYTTRLIYTSLHIEEWRWLNKMPITITIIVEYNGITFWNNTMKAKCWKEWFYKNECEQTARFITTSNNEQLLRVPYNIENTQLSKKNADNFNTV